MNELNLTLIKSVKVMDGIATGAPSKIELKRSLFLEAADFHHLKTSLEYYEISAELKKLFAEIEIR